MQVSTIRTTTQPTTPFPVRAVDKARGLLLSARDRVQPMIDAGPKGNELAAVRRDVMTAVRLLSRATSVDVPFSHEMTDALDHAFDAALALSKAQRIVKHVDSGAAQSLQRDAIMQAHRLLDRAYTSALAGTHP